MTGSGRCLLEFIGVVPLSMISLLIFKRCIAIKDCIAHHCVQKKKTMAYDTVRNYHTQKSIIQNKIIDSRLTVIHQLFDKYVQIFGIFQIRWYFVSWGIITSRCHPAQENILLNDSPSYHFII